MKQACKKCKRLVTKDKCPVCQGSKLTKAWKGRIVVFNTEKSELAKKLGIDSTGEYAVRI